MPNIVELQVFYRTKDGEIDSMKQAPTTQDTPQIKLDVARMVKQIAAQGNAEYWYMVVKVRKSDGGFGYRTMIPKTLFT